MSFTLWSPNLLLSNLKFLTGQPLMQHGSARVRKQIAKEYARSIAGLGMTLGVATMAAVMLGGEPPELDPRSSEFLKPTYGNTRLDFLGGMQQFVVLAARLSSGESKTLRKQDIVKIRGKVPFGHRDAWGVMSGFLRSKLSPGLGLGIDLTVGENLIGEELKFDFQTVFLDNAPLSVQDIIEAGREDGIPTALTTGVFTMLGVGASTIPYPPARKNRDIAAEAYVLIRDFEDQDTPKKRLDLVRKRDRAFKFLIRQKFTNTDMRVAFLTEMRRRRLKQDTILRNMTEFDRQLNHLTRQRLQDNEGSR